MTGTKQACLIRLQGNSAWRVSCLAASVLLVVVFCSSNATFATQITVPGFSFEDPVTVAPSYVTQSNVTPTTGWIGSGGVTGVAGVLRVVAPAAHNFPGGTPDGTQFGFGDSDSQFESAADLTTISASTTYRLKVALGRRNGGVDQDDYTISLYADDGIGGETDLASLMVDAKAEIPLDVVNGTFKDFSVAWTAPASGGVIGRGLRIRLAHALDGPSGQGAFDNVRLEIIHPEPSTAILATLGLLGLGMTRRRRRR